MQKIIVAMVILLSGLVNAWSEQIPGRKVKFYNDSKCQKISGTCLDMERYSCSVGIVPLQCGGPTYRLCCPDTGTITDNKTKQVVAPQDIVERAPAPAVKPSTNPANAAPAAAGAKTPANPPASPSPKLSLKEFMKLQKKKQKGLMLTEEEWLVMSQKPDWMKQAEALSAQTEKPTKTSWGWLTVEAVGAAGLSCAVNRSGDGLSDKEKKTNKGAVILSAVVMLVAHFAEGNQSSTKEKLGAILVGAGTGYMINIHHDGPAATTTTSSIAPPPLP